MLPGSAAVTVAHALSIPRATPARATGIARAAGTVHAHAAQSVHVAVVSASSVTTTTSAPNFLVPNGTFFAELVLFIIVFAVVAAVILPPLQKAMDERAERVRSAQQASDQGQAEADRLVAERRAALEAARAEARSILDVASTRAEELFQDGRTRGQAEHDRILSEAQPSLDEERATVERELMGRMSELVVAAAGRVVGEPVDVAKHRRVIDDAVGRATRDDNAGRS
jgi:F-type H+-transporting ATPase subunit b